MSRERRIQQLMGRLRRSAAMLVASRRRHEVVEVVGRAETDEEATEAVSELLDIDEDSSRRGRRAPCTRRARNGWSAPETNSDLEDVSRPPRPNNGT